MEMIRDLKIEENRSELKVFVNAEIDVPYNILSKAFTESERISQWLIGKYQGEEEDRNGDWKFVYTDDNGSRHRLSGKLSDKAAPVALSAMMLESSRPDVYTQSVVIEQLDFAKTKLAMFLAMKSKDEQNFLIDHYDFLGVIEDNFRQLDEYLEELSHAHKF